MTKWTRIRNDKVDGSGFGMTKWTGADSEWQIDVEHSSWRFTNVGSLVVSTSANSVGGRGRPPHMRFPGAAQRRILLLPSSLADDHCRPEPLRPSRHNRVCSARARGRRLHPDHPRANHAHDRLPPSIFSVVYDEVIPKRPGFHERGEGSGVDLLRG